MYKIIEINEIDLSKFKGKIIHVINSERAGAVLGTADDGTFKILNNLWKLTCLVDVE